MTVFLRDAKSYMPRSEATLDLHQTLPAGNFVVKSTPFNQLYFEQVDSFELPSKLYGDTNKIAMRTIETYLKRGVNTGILLSGEKGSGKTLLAKTISVRGAEMGYPTIIINSPFTGDLFYELLQGVTQPCIVQFDEFEKVYDREAQTEILTLLDGVFQAKKLFILTCNDMYRIDEHMMNRPGRIYYSLTFKGLDTKFIREYLLDNLNDKQYIDNVCTVSTLFSSFNFDMLKALVEEMNRHNQSPEQALELLNIKAFSWSYDERYSVDLYIGNQHITHDNMDQDLWSGNPLTRHDIDIGYYAYKQLKPKRGGSTKRSDVVSEESCKDDKQYCVAGFVPSDLKDVSDKSGAVVYTFVNDNSEKVVFTKMKHKDMSYGDYF